VNTLSYKTVSANAASVEKNWVVVDAEGQTLGRLASKVALLIRGKRKPNYTPHVDCGDNVIIVNAEKVVLSGNKMTDKTYVWHTGYPGGQRTTNPDSNTKDWDSFSMNYNGGWSNVGKLGEFRMNVTRGESNFEVGGLCA
jgi:hypothetical protein